MGSPLADFSKIASIMNRSDAIKVGDKNLSQKASQLLENPQPSFTTNIQQTFSDDTIDKSKLPDAVKQMLKKNPIPVKEQAQVSVLDGILPQLPQFQQSQTQSQPVIPQSSFVPNQLNEARQNNNNYANVDYSLIKAIFDGVCKEQLKEIMKETISEYFKTNQIKMVAVSDKIKFVDENKELYEISFHHVGNVSEMKKNKNKK